jgi:cellulose biosynthesis protein BcsQ
MEIAKSVAKEGERRVNELFLYCKQMLAGFDQFDYILVDCPPNKMFLTQAMLRACSYYMPVTIPDAISVYGMPRLLRWVKKIDAHDRPKLLGYVLNAINRTGGVPGGKVYSQQDSETRLLRDIRGSFQKKEEEILGNRPAIGVVPRLDAIARFLGEEGTKYSRFEFQKKTSGQDTIDQCLTRITHTILKRIEKYSAKT